MDETSTAFALPYARATATHSGPPLDRISVRDYVRSADIGAFSAEHGVDQRLRFNIVLEVAHHPSGNHDDVDRVISYDTITEAIDGALGSERVDLLETLAERVARACLHDPRAVRVFVRIEKLDRIPGSLGVEIVRNRVPTAQARIHSGASPVPVRITVSPVVVFVGAGALAAPEGRAWRDALIGIGRPVVVCLSARTMIVGAPHSVAERRIGLLAIEQAAWMLANADPRFEVIGTRTELDHSLRMGHHPIWAPSRMIVAAGTDCSGHAGDPEMLASWLAGQIGARDLVLVSDAGSPEHDDSVRLHRLSALDADSLASCLED